MTRFFSTLDSSRFLSTAATLATIALALTLWGCSGEATEDVDASHDETSHTTGNGHSDHDHSSTPAATGGSVTLKQGSPKETFDSLLDAISKNDMNALPRLYKPETQREMAQGMIGMAATASMNPMVDADQVNTILAKHGIKPADVPKMGPDMEAQGAALLDKLDDPGAFAGDMMSMLMTNPMMKQSMPATTWAVYKQGMLLDNINIEGDTATADVNVPGGDDAKDIQFVRVDGKWYLGD